VHPSGQNLRQKRIGQETDTLVKKLEDLVREVDLGTDIQNGGKQSDGSQHPDWIGTTRRRRK